MAEIQPSGLVSEGLRRFKPYPAYKKSGVEWLADVPAHWRVVALKRIGDLQAGAGFPEDDQGLMTEEIPFFKVGDMGVQGNEREMSEYQHTVSRATVRRLRAFVFPPATVVFAKVGAALLLNRRRILNRPSCLDNNMMGFMPRACDLAWSMYWLTGLDMGELANPGAVPSVNEGQMRDTPTLVPPDVEQRAIAAFLDRETARIDALVAKKERLIELLQEQRTALITRAVTKGRDPRVPMKDSGVEWLGEVPESWDLKPLKHLLRAPLAYGVLKPDKYEGGDGVPLVRILDVDMGVVRQTQLDTISPEQSAEYGRTLVQAGDLVVSVVGTIGRCFVVPASLEGANLSRALARVQLNSNVSARFLELCLASTPFVSFVELIPAGTAQRVLNLGDLGKFLVALPPVEEQERIVEDVLIETGAITALEKQIRVGIDRLKELRIALISAAVTGKIDVRGERA